MSKRKKITRNEHHLCFPRKEWAGGYGQLIRSAFVYKVDWTRHDALHQKLNRVPRPSEDKLEAAWNQLQRDRHDLNPEDIRDGLNWLMRTIDDQAFCEAIAAQIDHFSHK